MMVSPRTQLTQAAQRALTQHPGMFEGMLIGHSFDDIARRYDLTARLTLKAYLVYREKLAAEETARLKAALVPETEEEAEERQDRFKSIGVPPQRQTNASQERKLKERIGEQVKDRPWETWMTKKALMELLDITPGQLAYRFINWPHYQKRGATPEEMKAHGQAVVCRVIGSKPHTTQRRRNVKRK